MCFKEVPDNPPVTPPKMGCLLSKLKAIAVIVLIIVIASAPPSSAAFAMLTISVTLGVNLT